MENNKSIKELLEQLSTEELEDMIKKVKKDIEITKLNIIKKDVINKKLDNELNN